MTEKFVCVKWPEWCKTGACVNPMISRQGCEGCQTSIGYPFVNELLNENQMNRRLDHLKTIREKVPNHKVALVLGAGISVPSEMPMWSALISKMMGYAIEWELLDHYHYCKAGGEKEKIKSQLNLVRKLIEKKICLLGKVNTLESAEYVAQFFDDPAAETLIREKLPETAIHTMIARMIDDSLLPYDLFKKDAPPNCGTILDFAKKSGWKAIAGLNTMFAVSYLMSADKGIHQAMTYNYDPLVQEHMMDIYGVAPNQITTHPGKWNTVTGANSPREVFHVHGFVSGNRHKQKGLANVYPNESGPLVLSEDSYYRIEQKEAYNWSSSIQSYFFNKYNCVFVGFSAEDYNFRRILRQRGDRMQGGIEVNQPTHYLILTIDDWITDTYRSVCSAYWDEYKESSFSAPMVQQEQVTKDAKCLLQHILDSREKYWRRFGIVPIWATVKEIPQLLVNLIQP